MITPDKSPVKRILAIILLVFIVGAGLAILISYIIDFKTSMIVVSWKPFVLFFLTAILSGFNSKDKSNG